MPVVLGQTLVKDFPKARQHACNDAFLSCPLPVGLGFFLRGVSAKLLIAPFFIKKSIVQMQTLSNANIYLPSWTHACTPYPYVLNLMPILFSISQFFFNLCFLPLREAFIVYFSRFYWSVRPLCQKHRMHSWWLLFASFLDFNDELLRGKSIYKIRVSCGFFNSCHLKAMIN
jgi:hypothetical protein